MPSATVSRDPDDDSAIAAICTCDRLFLADTTRGLRAQLDVHLRRSHGEEPRPGWIDGRAFPIGADDLETLVAPAGGRH